MNENANSPAYPVVGHPMNDSGKLQGQLAHGLNKREYFAAMAMQGLLAHYGCTETVHTGELLDDGMTSQTLPIQKLAIQRADALLAALGD